MMKVDVSEPLEVLTALQQAIPAALAPLNDEGWADYFWTGAEEDVHVERKSWRHLTTSLDAVEDQLRREKHAHPDARLILMVEDIAVPGPFGTVIYSKARGTRRDVFYANSEQATRYSKLMAWVYQVEKFVEVYMTPTKDATVQALVAFYNGDQKAEHSTFHRYLNNMDWHPNPQVQKLISIGHGSGIGPAKAEGLIRRFGTVWQVLNATPKDLAAVAGIGKVNATRLLRGVGRLDV